jgi:DNA-binding response OmpR family regulator
MNRILIIDHDPAFSEAITDCLKDEGFAVISMQDGVDGLQQVLGSEAGYDMILLDTLLPDMNGFEVLEQIRSRLDTPVILLADPSQKTLEAIGLELGADDFLLKPCNPRELLARIRAILRRTKIYIRNQAMPALRRIVVGDIELDAATRVVRRDGERLRLTSTEFDFLEMLMRSAGHIVSREHLALSILGHELGAYDRSVDMHVCRLRKKLGHQYNGIERIKTIRGAGFIYTMPVPFVASDGLGSEKINA